LAILVIGQLILGLGDLGEVLLVREWEQVGETLLIHLQTRDFWLWLYLIFAISNAMLPSETDREPWRPVLLALGLAAVSVYLVGRVNQDLNELTRAVPEVLAEAVLTGLSYLAYAFSLTIVVDAVFMTFIAALEWLVSRLTGKRVAY
jgi:hypothetical protein